MGASDRRSLCNLTAGLRKASHGSQNGFNLLERVLRNIGNNTFDMVDHGGTAPFVHYLSPELFEAEKQKLLWRFPVGLAHLDQLKRPGDYVLRDIAGRSVLMVRGRDGEIRAFLNACRHRAAELVTEP